MRPHARTWRLEQLAQLGFDASVLDWDITRLSSGEKQRLALARALSLKPRALLLDEPTANLDQTHSAAVETLVGTYRVDHGIPVLWVSHDGAQRRRVAQRVAHIADRRIYAEAAPWS